MGKLKGQWYIIAGILISFSMLSFFHIYYSYSKVDMTSVLFNNEDNYAMDIVSDLSETRNNSPITENKLADTGELLRMIEGSLQGKGYSIKYDYNASSVKLNITGTDMRVNIRR